MKPESLVEYARQHLAQDIVAGRLRPGQRIKEEEIAARLGISRPPLREAFKSLEAEGLVTRAPRRGVFVSEIAETDVWEIYTLKGALYSLATALAVDRITEKDLARLERTAERMEECLRREPPEVERYQSFHEDFHGLLMEIGGNRRLKRIAESLHAQVKRFSAISLADKEHLTRSCAYHRRILTAIREQDRERAVEITRDHIQGALEVLQGMFSLDATPVREGSGSLRKAV
jgi:DNA-binding GntR family transcriptional regulator